MIVFRVVIYSVLFLSLVSCNSSDKEKKSEKPVTSVQVKSMNEAEKDTATNIVAKVNDTVITKSQLDYTMTRFLPKKIDENTKEELSKKVLRSLVDSRLMAILEEGKLDKQERELLNTKVEAYREELLVKRYITDNIEPQPITQESIYQYYQSHLEDFGQSIEKTYEIIQSKATLTETERVVLLTELSNLSTVENWLSWVTDNKKLGLSYRKATSAVEILEEPLRGLINATADGKTSPLLNKEILTVVRVEKSKKVLAKPFNQVSGSIRRMMAPQALKKSIRDHLIKLKKNASINYLLKYDSNSGMPNSKSDITGLRK